MKLFIIFIIPLVIIILAHVVCIILHYKKEKKEKQAYEKRIRDIFYHRWCIEEETKRILKMVEK